MKKQTGFTLVELLITMLIVGILLAVGVPSLKSFLQGNQLIAATNELLSALHIARSEAIKLNTNVTLCESSNGTTCSNTGDWEDGWIVFVDSNTDRAGTGAACTATGTDCLLRVHAAITDIQLTMTGENAGGATISSYTFNSRGLPRGAGGGSQSGSFSVCSLDESGNTLDSRAVVVGLSGRVRVSDNAAVISCP